MAEGDGGVKVGHVIETKIRLWENDVQKIELYKIIEI